MTDYPIEADKLLRVAETLAPANPGRGRPAYTGHRRAVSTAYYALFHAVSARVATQVFPDFDRGVHDRVRRWINHGDVRYVANQVGRIAGTLNGQPESQIRDILDPSILDRQLVAVADDFRELNGRREDADYDHSAVFTRNETRRLMATAERACAAAESIDTPGSRAFFGLIGFRARISNR